MLSSCLEATTAPQLRETFEWLRQSNLRISRSETEASQLFLDVPDALKSQPALSERHSFLVSSRALPSKNPDEPLSSDDSDAGEFNLAFLDQYRRCAVDEQRIIAASERVVDNIKCMEHVLNSSAALGNMNSCTVVTGVARFQGTIEAPTATELLR